MVSSAPPTSTDFAVPSIVERDAMEEPEHGQNDADAAADAARPETDVVHYARVWPRVKAVLVYLSHGEGA